MVSEEFERGLKPCGFREVSEGSESFQRGLNQFVVSEGFQSRLKPRGFRRVSEESETVWFERGFRGV